MTINKQPMTATAAGVAFQAVALAAIEQHREPSACDVPPHLRGAISPDQWAEMCREQRSC